MREPRVGNARRYLEPVERVVRRLNLGLAGSVAAAGALAVIVGSLVAFGGVSEDVTQHNGLQRPDFAHLRFFTERRPTVLVRLAKVVTELGAVPVLALVAAIAALFLWRRGLRIALALAPALSLCLAGSAAAVVKHVVGRARPPVALHLVNESDASFPSGHATVSAAFYLTLALVVALFVFRRTIVRALTIALSGVLVVAIGASRLVLGVHWPTDVLAGWSLGVSAAMVVTVGAVLVARSTRDTRDPARGFAQRVFARVADIARRQRQPPSAVRRRTLSGSVIARNPDPSDSWGLHPPPYGCTTVIDAFMNGWILQA